MALVGSSLQIDLPQDVEATFAACRRTLQRELRHIASLEDIEDGLQDALVDFLQREGEAPVNASGWLYVAARRRVIDRWRTTHGRRRNGASIRRFEPLDAIHEQDRLVGIDELAAVVDEAQSNAARAALAQLPREQQRLLGLVLEGYGHAEIAAVVGARSTKAVEGRVARAWEALRRVFIATERDEQCVPTRAALFSRRDSRDAQARVALHLDTCPNCRAFERRAKGLIAVSPLPAEPLWQPWLYRLAEVLPGRSPGTRAAETAAGAGGGAAAAGLAGSGGLAVGIKVCGTAAVTASVCSIALINTPEKPAKRPTRPEPKVRSVKLSDKKNAVALATATATPTRTPTPQPTATPRARRRTSSPRTSQSEEPPRSTAAATQRAEAPVIQTAPAGAQEFEPGGDPDAPTPPTAAPAAGGSEFLP